MELCRSYGVVLLNLPNTCNFDQMVAAIIYTPKVLVVEKEEVVTPRLSKSLRH